MKLIKYYRDAAIYPALFIIFFSLVNLVIGNAGNGIMADGSALFMGIVHAILFALVMCIFSLTIFLNKIKSLQMNFIFSLMTWFLLPFGYLAAIYVYDLNIRSKFEFGFGDDFFHLLIMTLPFIIGLSLTFMNYRKALRVR